MKKIAQWVGFLCLIVLALAAVGFNIYGQYQQSQLYPRINQELGYQQCVAQVQQAQVQQQVTQQNNVKVE